MADPTARAFTIEVPPPADGAGWILLLPAGDLAARDGRRWVHDDPAAVLAATRERAGGTPLVIDYEHQTDYSPENGQPAPAAGWIREVEVRAGALWGRVEWTERAAASLAAREYRFLSPTFAYDRATRRVRALHRAALTNSPAFDMPALARDGGDQPMTPEQLAALAAALGLAKDAAPEAVVAKAKELAEAKPPGAAELAAALGLASDAAPEAVVAKAKELAEAKPPADGQFVPRAEYDRTAAALAAIQSERAEERAARAVDAAVEAGKAAPSLREWAMGYARSDPDGFAAWVAAAPVVVAPGRAPGPAPGIPPADAALTSEERALCRQLRISEDAFRASAKEIAEREAV